MDLREQIQVNGVRVRLKPYTELRYKQMQKIEDDIDAFVQQNNDKSFKDIPVKDKAQFWMRKARILWEPEPRFDQNGEPVELTEAHWDKKEQFFTPSFFEDDAFE